MTSRTDKWVFIVNPVAGNGISLKYKDILKEKINLNQIDAEIILTLHKGHATEIATEFAKKGFNHIIAVGGDVE